MVVTNWPYRPVQKIKFISEKLPHPSLHTSCCTSLPANPKDYPNLDYSCFIGHLRGQSGRKIDQHRLRALPKHSVFPSINNYTIFLDVCILRICVFISCFEILESAAEDAMNLADRCAWKLQCFPSSTTAPCSLPNRNQTMGFAIQPFSPKKENQKKTKNRPATLAPWVLSACLSDTFYHDINIV